MFEMILFVNITLLLLFLIKNCGSGELLTIQHSLGRLSEWSVVIQH